MKNIIAIIALALLMSSCGVFHKSVQRQDNELNADISTELKADIDLSAKTDVTHQAQTVITEKIDTQITVPARSVIVARPLTELLENKSIVAQDGTASVTITYDPTTGTIKAEGKNESFSMPVKASKVTQREEDYKSSETLDQETNIKADTSVEVQEKLETEQVIVDKETSSGFGWGAWSALLFIAIMCAVGFFLERRFF